MPSKTTLERARKARRQGKAPTTQAGEFVREEIEHVRSASTVRAARSRRSPSASPRRDVPA